mmetsp:Transcript_40063/g.98456  ORF Transcript_40063/g.98456 Transcript_40063/m.98456 type:complete len:210 (-) Transcript_40063:249-878(-)
MTRSQSSTTIRALRASSLAWCWMLIARWSQQLPRSVKAFDAVADSWSPDCCSWFPRVMRVSPSSARELARSFRRRTSRSRNLWSSESCPSISLMYVFMPSNSSSGGGGSLGAIDMSFMMLPKKEGFFSSGSFITSSEPSKNVCKGLESWMTGCCTSLCRYCSSAMRRLSTKSSWKRLKSGVMPDFSGSAGMKWHGYCSASCACSHMKWL